MGLIQSAASGYWDVAATWVDETLPDLAVDDVEILDGHTLTIRDPRTLLAPHTITILEGASLVIGADGLLTIESGILTNAAGGLIVDGGILDVAAAGALELNAGSMEIAVGAVGVAGTMLIALGGSMVVQPGATLSIDDGGALTIMQDSSARIDGAVEVDGDSILNVQGGGLDIRGAGLLSVVSGQVGVYTGGTLALDRGGRMTLTSTTGLLLVDGASRLRFTRRERTVAGDTDHPVVDFLGAYGFGSRPMTIGGIG